MGWGGTKAAFSHLYNQISLFVHFNISLKAWAISYIQVNTYPRKCLVHAEMSPVTVPKVKDESTKPLL